MEKVEKNLISNNQNGKKNKNLIKASTILEITLEDYHQSRKLYGQDSSTVNFEKFKQGDSRKDVSPNIEKLKDENLFEEFYEDSIETNNNVKSRVSIAKLNKNSGSSSSSSVVKNDSSQRQEPIKNSQDMTNKLKSAIFNYIKEKELDMYL
jgi:hypothetical protein